MTKPVFLVSDSEIFGVTYGCKWYNDNKTHLYGVAWRGEAPWRYLQVSYALSRWTWAYRLWSWLNR